MPGRGVGGMHGREMCMPRERAWLGGMCGRREVCMAGGHAWWGCVWQGRAWHAGPPHTHHEIRLVNARPVGILLECILVLMVDLGYVRAKAIFFFGL